jgi:threonine/homoserine/homoserine lactone efflux protein
LIGGLALIIFGILTAKNAKHAKLSVSAGVVMAGPTMSGAITSAANPYFWIWWLSVGSALVLDGLSNSILIAVAFMIGHWGADFGWYMLVSASVAKGRTILTPFAYRYALFICGVFLILFGVYYLSRTFA